MPKTYNRAFHVFLSGAHKKWNKCKLYSLKLNSNVTWLIAVYIESIKMESERKKNLNNPLTDVIINWSKELRKNPDICHSSVKRYVERKWNTS